MNLSYWQLTKSFGLADRKPMPGIVTNPCLVVFVGMATVMRREDIAKTAEKGRWTDVKLTPKGFVQLSDTSAVIAYDCTARRKDGKPHHALVSSGYVQRADGWKLATHQQTEVPAKS